MQNLTKLKSGDKVAIVSPSFAAAGQWPHVYELGLKRLREIFKLEPVEFPTTKKIGASGEERARDLISAFENPEIKAVITTLGGDDQVTYIKNLPKGPFQQNPKPFFGYSDNTHFENFLWLAGVPSYYGGCIFTEYATQGEMNSFTIQYLNKALFETGEVELTASDLYNDIELNWNDPTTLTQKRVYEKNDGWRWDLATSDVDRIYEGITWGGCLGSLDEILRHGLEIPTPKQFEEIVLFTETSEEVPEGSYVARFYRALGERGILERVKGVLVGRPKAWGFDKPNNKEEKAKYREEQRKVIIEMVRRYNKTIPIIQNLDFGHTAPQIPLPNGRQIKIDGVNKKIIVSF